MKNHNTGSSWTPLSPRFRAAQRSTPVFVDYAKQLARQEPPEQRDEVLEELWASFVASFDSWPRGDSQALLAAGLVLTDLARQRWQMRIRKGIVEICPPEEIGADFVAEKERVRQQELVKRDAQLRRPAVQKFIHSMEARTLHEGRFVSIFSLMRDGRELARSLRAVRDHCNDGSGHLLDNVIDPYLQFVSEEERCVYTGFRLMDIWRYFRHTWTNQYTSIPGRSMMFLVRDRASLSHPVLGIGALSSSIIQIRERDTWIGWYPETFIAQASSKPTVAIAEWLIQVVDSAIQGIYVDDFLEDGLLAVGSIRKPDDATIARLLDESAEQRRLHYRYARSQDHKRGSDSASPDCDYWVGRARTNLFRSKRALALAEYLQARIVLNRYFGAGATSDGLTQLLSTGTGVNIVRKIVRKAKADRVGIAMADISVCGAVQPYNALLGGKLVSMLAASPGVILEYKRRYGDAKSEIASSMAGRPIVRPADLVLLATTSLYGVGSSQYNRVKIPCEVLGGCKENAVYYERLGRSEAFGTSHYCEETVEALVALVQQSNGGQRVNSIFGEGVSPKFRKVRDGLELLGFPSDLLLRHHRRRIVYGITLVRNMREYLLGMNPEPDYMFPLDDSLNATRRIAEWWKERWLYHRIQSDAVLEEVEQHTLVWPIRHGARVPLWRPENEHRQLFLDFIETD